MKKNTENATVHKDVTKSIVASSRAWDEAGDYGDVQFYDATLACDTQKFKKGDVVGCIVFSFTTNCCEILNEAGTEVAERFALDLKPVFY